MRKIQVAFAVEMSTVVAMAEEAKAAGLSFPEYCRQVFAQRTPVKGSASAPDVPFTSTPVTRVYDEKTFAEFQRVRNECEAWEVKLWLKNHPGFNPKAFGKPTARSARKPEKK